MTKREKIVGLGTMRELNSDLRNIPPSYRLCVGANDFRSNVKVKIIGAVIHHKKKFVELIVESKLVPYYQGARFNTKEEEK